jgi:cell division septum initiation protein DivIVA
MSDHSITENTNADFAEDFPLDVDSHAVETNFATSFRGYDRDEVDLAIQALNQRVAGGSAQIASLLEQVAHMQARLDKAEKQRQALSDEIKGASTPGEGNPKFQEILRIAEEEAHTIISNATTHGKRILEGAHEDAQKRIAEAQAEANLLLAQAQQDAEQARINIEDDLEAHAVRMEREDALIVEKLAQAQREADSIREQAQEDATALKAQTNQEITEERARAEASLRELLARATAVEESLVRRQEAS